MLNTWRGMMAPGVAVALLDKLKGILEKEEGVPWAAVSAHGFRDSPVAWRKAPAQTERGTSLVSVVVEREQWAGYEVGRTP